MGENSYFGYGEALWTHEGATWVDLLQKILPHHHVAVHVLVIAVGPRRGRLTDLLLLGSLLHLARHLLPGRAVKSQEKRSTEAPRQRESLGLRAQET